MRLNILLSFTLAITANAGKFNCPTYAAPPPPKTIADLNPAHVGVVMAMGDSITAAFAARSGLKEGRDISWSIGVGEADQLTLPYMLSQYSPKLVGASSTSTTLPEPSSSASVSSAYSSLVVRVDALLGLNLQSLLIC